MPRSSQSLRIKPCHHPAPLILSQRDSVSKSLFDDLGQATRAAARALVKPHIDYALARKALGVDPSQTAPAQ